MSCGTTVMFATVKCNNMYALVLTRSRLGLDSDSDSTRTRTRTRTRRGSIGTRLGLDSYE